MPKHCFWWNLNYYVLKKKNAIDINHRKTKHNPEFKQRKEDNNKWKTQTIQTHQSNLVLWIGYKYISKTNRGKENKITSIRNKRKGISIGIVKLIKCFIQLDLNWCYNLIKWANSLRQNVASLIQEEIKSETTPECPRELNFNYFFSVWHK